MSAALDLERLRALLDADELTDEMAASHVPALLALVADLQRERDEAQADLASATSSYRAAGARVERAERLLAEIASALAVSEPGASAAASAVGERQGRQPGSLSAMQARVERAEQALREIAQVQEKALAMIERNNFVFDDIGHEPGNWQHLAFTLYTYICTVDTISRGVIDAALAAGREEQREEPARFGPICEVDDGSYRAVDRDGVLVVERADSAGALRHVEWESEEQRERWEATIRREETTRSR